LTVAVKQAKSANRMEFQLPVKNLSGLGFGTLGNGLPVLAC